VLDQTAESMTELGNMLQDMRHATDKLRQIFWEQEKKIEYLHHDLDQCDETRRQKEKRRVDLKSEQASLEKTLQVRKMELAVEKENEVAILKHQDDLKDRLQQLNNEIVLLEQKQSIVSLFVRLSHLCLCCRSSTRSWWSLLRSTSESGRNCTTATARQKSKPA